MPSYLIECYLPRSRADELPTAVSRLEAVVTALAAGGERIHHVRSTYLPSDELCLHLITAESAEQVSEASRRAGIEADRVVQAVPVATNDARGGAS